MKNILVVEDNDQVRKFFNNVFTDGGYQVTTAVDGIDGLARFQQVRPDLVLTDLNMPNMDGAEFTAQLYKQYGVKTVIMTAGQVTAEQRQIAKEAGACTIVSKIFTPSEILEILEDYHSTSKC